MEIKDFAAVHAESAARIAKMNYEAERAFVPALPKKHVMPDLSRFFQNRLGVAAFEGGEMIGFMCALPPFKNAFRSTEATGVFSPCCANGAIESGRREIYARMYRIAGRKWAAAGAASHAIALYAHDTEAHAQLFEYGFGMRCIDAVRNMTEIKEIPPDSYMYRELSRDEFLKVLPLSQMLDAHMAASPTFIMRPSESAVSFMEKAAFNNTRYFIAEAERLPVAYLEIQRSGESFICESPDYIHITGAYCLNAHRGKGVFSNLLSMTVSALREEGYARIGVDYESINPAARRFWPKYFGEFTHGLVRRIDENYLHQEAVR